VTSELYMHFKFSRNILRRYRVETANRSHGVGFTSAALPAFQMHHALNTSVCLGYRADITHHGAYYVTSGHFSLSSGKEIQTARLRLRR
jgi:hypothetical protein